MIRVEGVFDGPETIDGAVRGKRRSVNGSR